MLKFSFVFIFLNSLLSAQSQRFSYQYQFISDSTKKENQQSELMVLDVTPSFSKFYSEVVFKNDSISKSIYDKETAATGSFTERSDLHKGLIKYTVIKENPSQKTFFITRIGQSKLKIEEKRNFDWKILAEKQTVGAFTVQKATTTFAGRKWIAWFTTEIPLQEGPYKFHGLPGLIVKIEDETKSHQFELKGIKNLSAEELKNIDPNKNFVYDFGENVDMDYKKYKNFYIESRNDPNKSIRLALGDMAAIEIDGKMMTTNEFLRDREKQMKAKIAQDNNILELDLLK